MLRVRCLREPSNETPKEARLLLGQCPSMRHLSSGSQAFTRRNPRRSKERLIAPSHAGNLTPRIRGKRTRPLSERYYYTTKPPRLERRKFSKRTARIAQESFSYLRPFLPPFIHACPITSQCPPLSGPTRRRRPFSFKALRFHSTPFTEIPITATMSF